MTTNEAGGNASSARDDVPSKPPVSPAARKLAENIARRLVPQIEYARRQSTTANQKPIE
jgi:hypothetical protein